MTNHIRYVFLFFALVWIGLFGAAAGARAGDQVEPMILTTTAHGRDIDEVVAALNRAVVGHNFGFLRQQAMDARLVPYSQEVRSVRLYYFCNYARMSHALKLDPRATQMLPYRVTLVETPGGVDLIAVNPAWLTQGMGNPDLHGESLLLKQDYLAILDEAAI